MINDGKEEMHALNQSISQTWRAGKAMFTSGTSAVAGLEIISEESPRTQ